MAEEVTQKLKQTGEMLEKKQEYLEMKYDAENATAKRHARTTKSLALQALKRRKRVEEQLRKIDEALTILEFQREALENAERNTELLKNLNYAARGTLRKAQQALDMEDAHDTMDDIHEQTETSKEISEAICGVGSNQDFHDDGDDELRAELEAIEQEVPYSELFGMECLSMGLPDFPSTSPSNAQATKKKAAGPWSM